MNEIQTLPCRVPLEHVEAFEKDNEKLVFVFHIGMEENLGMLPREDNASGVWTWRWIEPPQSVLHCQRFQAWEVNGQLYIPVPLYHATWDKTGKRRIPAVGCQPFGHGDQTGWEGFCRPWSAEAFDFLCKNQAGIETMVGYGKPLLRKPKRRNVVALR